MNTLASLVDAALPQWPALDVARRDVVLRDCGAFVRGQIAGAPMHIRCGLMGLLAAFLVFAYLRAGLRPLPSLSRARRADLLDRFSQFPIAACAAFERIVRSMTLVAFLEHPLVTTAVVAEERCEDAEAGRR